MGLPRYVCCMSVCAAFLLAALPTHGQAVPTARRSSSLSLFAGGQVLSTDYNSNDTGFIVGGDFTRHLKHLDLSLDLRFNKATGDVVGEKSFVGGVQVAKGYGRFHPYAQFLVGYGVVTFDTPNQGPNNTLVYYDDSIVKDFGGGVDYRVTRLFSVKLDGQYQFWKLGVNEPLTPAIASIGIVFNIPYRYLRPRRY